MGAGPSRTTFSLFGIPFITESSPYPSYSSYSYGRPQYYSYFPSFYPRASAPSMSFSSPTTSSTSILPNMSFTSPTSSTSILPNMTTSAPALANMSVPSIPNMSVPSMPNMSVQGGRRKTRRNKQRRSSTRKHYK